MARAAPAKLDYPRKRMPVPGAPPARPDPAQVWVNILAMAVVLVAEIAAVVVAIRAQTGYGRLCGVSGLVLAHVVFVWLCCLLARARGYRPAIGLVGATLIGGLALPFLPAEEEGAIDVRGERAPYWVGLRHLASLIVLWGFVLAAFWNSFESGWVLDNLYIIKLDPRTQSQTWESGPNPLTAPGVIEYFRQDYWWPKGISGLYRPLTSITYWLNWTVFKGGTSTWGMHVVNMALHWIDAALVYALAFLLTRRWPVAIVAALVFAVHPITTESVTNIIGRADQFAALAVLGGLIAWRWAGALPRWWTAAGFALVMLITAFGVFAKESSIAIGLVILAYDVIYRWHPRLARLFGWAALLGLVPLFAAGSFAAQHPWWERMGDVMRAVVAVVAMLAGIGTHAFLTRTSPERRMGAILFSLVFCAIASAFVPAAGIALFGLVILYEACFGPWWGDSLGDFERIKIPAALYTAGFCAVVFLPLAIGAAMWFKAGAAAKLSEVGMLNVLGATWPADNPSNQSLGWGERIVRASLFVLAGLFAWVALTVRGRPRPRAIFLLLIAALPFTAAWLLKHDFGLLMATAGAAAALAVVGLVAESMLPGRDAKADDDRLRAAPWVALPVVLVAALGATLYLFYAGFALTFLVGLAELVRRQFLPRALRASTMWAEMVRRFVVGYYLLLPPVIMMFFVRYFIFNIQSTPPETPFLDNPLRGGPFDPLPFWQSRMTAIKVMGKLIYLLFWPVHLSSDYSWDQIPFFLDSRAPFVWENIKAVVALLFVAGMIWLAVWSYRRQQKAMALFVLFFFAAILPTSNLPVLIGSIMAERFMYLPLIGFAGAVAIGLVMLYDVVSRRLDADQVGFPRVARGAVGLVLIGVVFVLYARHAYNRNFAWKSDITLWEDAMTKSPRAFRCYQSLAFAYYEQDARGNIDKMIRTAEQARPIVDPLPHDRNSSRLYLHLGMYYNIKGELLSRPDGRGGLIVTPEARQWFENAVKVLERGVEVDRTFNSVNRRRQIERGDRPDRIYDSGLTPVYLTLGLSYQKLGMAREALNAFNYMRQLEPENPDSYLRIAVLHVEQQRWDEAAAALMQSMLLDPRRTDNWQLLAQIYAGYGEQGRGAIYQAPDGPKLNVDHPMVREHFMKAYRDFIRIFRFANRPHLADAARQAAIYRYRMPPSLFDYLMIEPIPEVTPDGLDYTRVQSGRR